MIFFKKTCKLIGCIIWVYSKVQAALVVCLLFSAQYALGVIKSYCDPVWVVSSVHPVKHRGSMLKHTDHRLHNCDEAFSYMVFSKILTFWSSAEARTVVQAHFYICSPLITFHFLALRSVPVLKSVQAFGRLLQALSGERKTQKHGGRSQVDDENTFDHLNSNIAMMNFTRGRFNTQSSPSALIDKARGGYSGRQRSNKW